MFWILCDSSSESVWACLTEITCDIFVWVVGVWQRDFLDLWCVCLVRQVENLTFLHFQLQLLLLEEMLLLTIEFTVLGHWLDNIQIKNIYEHLLKLVNNILLFFRIKVDFRLMWWTWYVPFPTTTFWGPTMLLGPVVIVWSHSVSQKTSRVTSN